MPYIRSVSASHNIDLAIRDTLKMRRLVSSEWYQERWPILLSADQNEKTKFENKETGFRQAMAMASMTGTRGNRITIDDPHTVEGALSEVKRSSDLRVFGETVTSRLIEPKSDRILVIMQRLHEKDIAATCIEWGYEHLCLPMEFEPDRRCKTKIGFADPRKKEGELLFEKRFPQSVIKQYKTSMGSYGYAAQCQQRPSPRGGGVIHGTDFKRYTKLPKFEYRKIFGDTAMKTGEHNDYSVFELWGACGDDAYLIDIMRGKWEAPELKRRAVDFWNKHVKDKNGVLRSLEIEDKASGTGLIQDLRTKSGIPVKGIKREGMRIHRDSRVQDCTPYIEAGHVWIPEEAEWVADFINECESFTLNDSHANDDQVDPMADAIYDMLNNESINIMDFI